MVSAVISVEHVQSEDGEWIPINFVLGGILLLSNLRLHVACASFINDLEHVLKTIILPMQDVERMEQSG